MRILFIKKEFKYALRFRFPKRYIFVVPNKLTISMKILTSLYEFMSTTYKYCWISKSIIFITIVYQLMVKTMMFHLLLMKKLNLPESIPSIIVRSIL